MNTETVLTMLADHLGQTPFAQRAEVEPEPALSRVFSAWITPHNLPVQHMYVEALTAHEAHGLARKAAFLMYPGRPFTTVIRSK